MDYVIHLLTIIAIFSLLAVSLDLLIGNCGLLSITHAAFAAIGAYASAIMTTKLGWPVIGGVFVGVLCAGALSTLLAYSALRLSGDTFAVATFGFHIILYRIFENWTELTGGPLGLAGIPPLTSSSILINSALIIFISMAGIYVLNKIRFSTFGLALRLIRDDEVFAQSVGKHVVKSKTIAVVIGSVFAAIAGSLYAHHFSYIDAPSFSMLDSIMIVCMVIIGGAASRWGGVVGAAIIILTPEALRFLGFPPSVAAIIKLALFGLLLVCVARWWPTGLMRARPSFQSDAVKY